MHGLQKCVFFCVLTLLMFTASVSGITHGEKVPKNSMLYMVSVQNDRGHLCGGFLISKDFVVTSAHCDQMSLTRVVLGAHNLRRVGSAKIRDIEKKYKHPSYVSVGEGKDIMLLKLSENVPLGNGIQTIEIPDSTKSVKENDVCRVAGWGYTETKHPEDELRTVNVSVINLQVCQREWTRLPANVICAGGYRTKKGFCQGDAGGPLVCNGKAVGIVSFNNGNCDQPDVPNVYTDISKFLVWIKKIIGTISNKNKSNFCIIKH